MKEIAFPDNLGAMLGPRSRDNKGPEENEKSFGDMLKGAIGQVNQLQKEANNAIMELAAGQEKDIHQTMIALEKAGVSFQLMMQVRNKIVGAYEEIMRMQI